MNIAIIPLKIKSPGLALMYEAVCSSYHMGSPMWLEHQTVRWHGSVGRTNCSKCPTGLVGRKYESMVAWLSR